MASVNKHNLKINGLRAACGETVDWELGSGGYTEIFYNRESGEVWTIDQVSLGHNSWTVYHDPNIIKVCSTSQHMTMQEIADAILEAVTNDDMRKEAFA